MGVVGCILSCESLLIFVWPCNILYAMHECRISLCLSKVSYSSCHLLNASHKIRKFLFTPSTFRECWT